jgi:hypothetical protein
VRETYDGPLTPASDMMVWNVTDEQIVVRGARVDENVAPTGTAATALPGRARGALRITELPAWSTGLAAE